MGGFIAYTAADKKEPVPVTVSAILFCCLEQKHLHIYEIPTEAQIKDKSKADWFTKTITVVQILRLLCSMASKAVCGLPTSQLELCTAAFSILSIATYLANWHTPKDVETAIHVLIPGKYHLSFDAIKSYGLPYNLRFFGLEASNLKNRQ
jgi:hypothetical protein